MFSVFITSKTDVWKSHGAFLQMERPGGGSAEHSCLSLVLCTLPSVGFFVACGTSTAIDSGWRQPLEEDPVSYHKGTSMTASSVTAHNPQRTENLWPQSAPEAFLTNENVSCWWSLHKKNPFCYKSTHLSAVKITVNLGSDPSASLLAMYSQRS